LSNLSNSNLILLSFFLFNGDIYIFGYLKNYYIYAAMYTLNTKINNQLSIWLFTMFCIISIMIVVGGLTRLTDSGLSITKWELFSGFLPPLNEKEWILEDVQIFYLANGVFDSKKIETLSINSIYDYEKINSLFKNFDTMSFLDLVFNYNELIDNGYNKFFLDHSLHSLLSLPFFLLVMTGLAAILTLNALKKSNNFKFILVGLISTVLIFYLKDLSIALGQTDRIPLILSIWAPVVALGLFIFIGVLQINEK